MIQQFSSLTNGQHTFCIFTLDCKDCFNHIDTVILFFLCFWRGKCKINVLAQNITSQLILRQKSPQAPWKLSNNFLAFPTEKIIHFFFFFNFPLKSWFFFFFFFQASSFQLLKLENLLRWSHFTFTFKLLCVKTSPVDWRVYTWERWVSKKNTPESYGLLLYLLLKLSGMTACPTVFP